ncbi:PHM/PNGase F domain-containing protein [Cladochytrium replicatum]|nr:PHM/PNGase F domain-containing protein [Cladochytrium replicatum]
MHTSYYYYSTLLGIAIILQKILAASAAPNWIPFDTTKWKRHLTLKTPADKPVELFWTLSPDLATIQVGIASNNSAGWLAVGFSETNGMKGADIALGYVNPSGQFVLEDRFTEDFVAPIVDTRQDLTLTGSWHTNAYTAFTFSRPTKAGCNNTQDRDLYVEPNSQQHVLVAFGTSMSFAQHAPTDRTSALVDLNSPTDAAAELLMNPPVGDLNLIPFNIISPNTTVPARETAYCYSYFEAPTDAKYHVIQELPVIHDPRVHHLVIYVCDTPPTQLFNSTSPSVQCDIPNPCLKFFAEWAPGIRNRTYPQDFGKPVGQGNLSARYFMLEVHYNQVDPTGYNDPGAGYQLMLSRKLRNNDLGILAAGMSPQEISTIPARRIISVTYEFPEECSRLLKQNLTITGVFVHMHKRGHSGELSIIRQGTNRSESLVKVNYFDFNSQGTTRIEPRTLVPGDRILTTCVWDSTREANDTRGGLGSNEEMCFGFIEYYPLQAVSMGWRLPRLFDANGRPINTTVGPLEGNAALCVLGNVNTSQRLTIPPFNTPLPELGTCSTSGSRSTAELWGRGSFLAGCLVAFLVTLAF